VRREARLNALDALASVVQAAALAARAPAPRPGPPRKVLVLGYGAVGDTLFFLPALEALKRSGAALTFLANPSPITRELIPAAGLAEVWQHAFVGASAEERRAINARIAAAGFDATVLSLSSPAGYYREGLASIPLRVGHARPAEPGWGHPLLTLRRLLVTGELVRGFLLNKPVPVPASSECAVERDLRLLSGFGLPVPAPAPMPSLPVSDADRRWADEALKGLDPGKRLVAVHLGAPGNQYGKMWDARRFGELCAALAEAWPVEFVVVGGPEERPRLEEARGAFPFARELLGRSTLPGLFAVLSRAALCLSNDTGIAKASAALGVPTATIYGLSDTVEVGTPWEREKHLDIRTGIACSPCARFGMPREDRLNYLTCGHRNCLAQLSVGFALAALRAKYDALFAAARA
jgi:ADP-heptose:LPS heptosyltransferase